MNRLSMALALSTLGCVPQIPPMPPALRDWAAEKAAALATCTAQGHRGHDLLRCLGTYAEDRGTYACERANTATAE